MLSHRFAYSMSAISMRGVRLHVDREHEAMISRHG